MVLILTNKVCSTTNYVCNYLLASNIKFLRITSDDEITINWLTLDDSNFNIGD